MAIFLILLIKKKVHFYLCVKWEDRIKLSLLIQTGFAWQISMEILIRIQWEFFQRCHFFSSFQLILRHKKRWLIFKHIISKITIELQELQFNATWMNNSHQLFHNLSFILPFCITWELASPRYKIKPGLDWIIKLIQRITLISTGYLHETTSIRSPFKLTS